jgi:hypothetical protein
MRAPFLSLALTVLLTAPAAFAAPTLIAQGTLSASSAGPLADLSGLTGKLENGMAANILGGVGSGLAYAGNGLFLAVPDRGPNATAYNPKIDNTVTWIPRFHTIQMALTPAAAGSALPFTLTPTLRSTTLLWNATALTYGPGNDVGAPAGAPSQNSVGKYYFTGRSDAYDRAKTSTHPDNGRFDAEAIQVSNDGRFVFISDEYGPYLYQFDRATGARVTAFKLPGNLDSPVLSPIGDTEIGENTVGRTANKGMEGLAITPDGRTLVGIMQAALVQDNAVAATKKLIRIVTIDIASGATKEFGYMLTDGTGVSEIIAINDHEFLLDERDGAGLGDNSAAKVKKVFRIDIAGATDITNLYGQRAVDAAVKKTQFLDLVALLGANGVAADKVPAKIEGMAFGPDVTINGTTLHTLFFSNDNDFVPDVAGPNVFYVVAFSDADLPGLVRQQVAPLN